MSKYTTELRVICDALGRDEVESWFSDYKLEDYLSEEQIETIEENTNWTKERLASDIVDAYLMREICAETPGLFAHFAKVAMRQVMEAKLPAIYSVAIKYDVLDSNSITETMSRSTNTNSESTSDVDGSGLSVNSDTPQGQINKQSILQGNYATNTNANESESSAHDVSNANGTESYTRTIKGRNGYKPSEILKDYRKSIIAINRDIIKELDGLFYALF